MSANLILSQPGGQSKAVTLRFTSEQFNLFVSKICNDRELFTLYLIGHGITPADLRAILVEIDERHAAVAEAERIVAGCG